MRVKGGVIGLLACLAVLGEFSQVYGNGDVQRELEARVVAVDQQAGRFEVERQFRDKTWRLTLKLTPETLVFSCAQQAVALEELQAGDVVSVYYEPIGREGVVTLIVIEPKAKGAQ